MAGTIVPTEASQAPKELVSNLITDVSLIVSNLSDQVVAKYQTGDQMQIAVARAYEGQVLGATVEANPSTVSIQNEGCHSDTTADSILKIPYEYKGPDMEQIKLSLNKLIQK